MAHFMNRLKPQMVTQSSFIHITKHFHFRGFSTTSEGNYRTTQQKGYPVLSFDEGMLNELRGISQLKFGDWEKLMIESFTETKGEGHRELLKLSEERPEIKTRLASVMLLFQEIRGKPSFLFIKRANRGKHAGQIALPGGKWDPKLDSSLKDTAIRETKEEVGVDTQSHSLKIYGEMPSMISNQFGFYVSIFIGSIKKTAPYLIQTTELDHVIEISMEDLLASFEQNGGFKDEKNITWHGPMFSISYDPIENKKEQHNEKTPIVAKEKSKAVIWGLTARILTKFFQVVLEKGK